MKYGLSRNKVRALNPRTTERLLSRPAATLSSIQNGGEGRGEEVQGGACQQPQFSYPCTDESHGQCPPSPPRTNRRGKGTLARTLRGTVCRLQISSAASGGKILARLLLSGSKVIGGIRRLSARDAGTTSAGSASRTISGHVGHRGTAFLESPVAGKSRGRVVGNMVGTAPAHRLRESFAQDSKPPFCAARPGANDSQAVPIARPLLSRPTATLSSIRNGGEGWGEEVLPACGQPSPLPKERRG